MPIGHQAAAGRRRREGIDSGQVVTGREHADEFALGHGPGVVGDDHAAISLAGECLERALDFSRVAHIERWSIELQATALVLRSEPDSWDQAASSRSCRTATRFVPGAISLSSSSHFPLIAYSKLLKPVMLPPGRAMLGTKPALSGSETPTNTIGTVRDRFCNASRIGVPLARIMSGFCATNSSECVAYAFGIGSYKPNIDPDISSFGPTQFLEFRAKRFDAVLRSGSDSSPNMSTPMRRVLSLCCARAANGHATAAPPSTAMNSRRFIQSPRRPRAPRVNGIVRPSNRAVPAG